ncbi:hypothetical protein [Natronorubrum sp. FCH18a]|uniref:hypothetical protein n=1 Tax=Natronorubrum sp. FCH18a TaxID=3447018 RepID=UPI003F511D8A
MTDRSSLVAACLVVLVVASLPAGAYSAASSSTPNASLQQEAEDAEVLDSLGCLPSPALRDISMNVYRQESTNLQTQGGTVASTSTGPKDEQETFEIESGSISASTICFSASDDERESVELQLNDVEFEDTSLTGPWTDVEFEQGEADSMTVVLPPEEVLSLLVQIPGSIDVIETIKDLFGIDGFELDETDPASNETDNDSTDEDGDVVNDTTDETGDTVENTTDEIGDTVENTTDPVDGAVNNTTDTVDDTVNETTDTVDDTVNETTDTVDDTVNETTDTADNTVNETTDTVDGVVNDTTETVDDTVDDTPDEVDDTVNDTTDAVDDTADETTDAVDDTVDETTDAVDGVVDTTTDLLTVSADSPFG